jgi:hypothetical protein
MEEWEKHYQLIGGKCYQMFFNSFKRIVKFKIKGTDSFGNRMAVDCETGEKFEFNRDTLLKVEYGTLIEINCADCQ